MKVKIVSAAKATLLIFILAGFAFWMKDAGDSFAPTFKVSEIVEVSKFEKVKVWIPEDSEFFFVIDVDRALANENLKKRFEAFVANNKGTMADLVRAMLGENGFLKMIVALGEFGDDAKRPEMVIIVQGDFANNDFIADLKKALNEAGSKLEDLRVAGRTILSEAGDEPFGLAELDDEHIIVGENAALISYLERADGKPSFDGNAIPDAPLFGRLVVGDRFTKLAPGDLSGISEIELASMDGETIYADIPCENSMKAMKLKIFLAGARSMLLIRANENESLRRVIEDVMIGGDGPNVLLSIKMSTLLDLW